MSTKLTKLTPEELTSLKNFMGACVLSGAKFPSERMGTSNVTIQELASERTVASLRNFGKFINKKLNDYDPDFSQSEPLRFGSISGDELVTNLKLLIRYKEQKEAEADARARVREIKSKLEDLKTPAERKAELEKELAEYSDVV